MASFDTDSWDEFDWERAFRQDDERVRLYMRELPGFIDLPEEDELLLAKIAQDPSYVKCDKNLSEKLSSYFISSAEGEEDNRENSHEEDPEAWQKRQGAAPFMLFSDLARLWAQEFARHPAGELPNTPFLRVAVIYGQLMLRSSDLLDLPEGEKRCASLKIAILKRILAGINFLCGELEKLESSFPQLSGIARSHYERLLDMREKLIDLLSLVRKEKAGEK